MGKEIQNGIQLYKHILRRLELLPTKQMKEYYKHHVRQVWNTFNFLKMKVEIR